MNTYLDQILSSWDHLDAFFKGVVYGCGSTISGALLGYAGRKVPLRGVKALGALLCLGLRGGPRRSPHVRRISTDLRSGLGYFSEDKNQLIRDGGWMVVFGPSGDPEYLCVWDYGIRAWRPITHHLSKGDWRKIAKAALRYRRDPLNALFSAPAVEPSKPRAWGAPTPEVKHTSWEEAAEKLEVRYPRYKVGGGGT